MFLLSIICILLTSCSVVHSEWCTGDLFQCWWGDEHKMGTNTVNWVWEQGLQKQVGPLGLSVPTISQKFQSLKKRGVEENVTLGSMLHPPKHAIVFGGSRSVCKGTHQNVTSVGARLGSQPSEGSLWAMKGQGRLSQPVWVVRGNLLCLWGHSRCVGISETLSWTTESDWDSFAGGGLQLCSVAELRDVFNYSWVGVWLPSGLSWWTLQYLHPMGSHSLIDPYSAESQLYPTSKDVRPAGQGRWSYSCALCWDLTWSAASRCGVLSIGEMWMCWSAYRGEPQKWSKGWNISPMRTGWESWGCKKGDRLCSRISCDCCGRTKRKWFQIREGEI